MILKLKKFRVEKVFVKMNLKQSLNTNICDKYIDKNYGR